MQLEIKKRSKRNETGIKDTTIKTGGANVTSKKKL
jgi:hypothetical protein